MAGKPGNARRQRPAEELAAIGTDDKNVDFTPLGHDVGEPLAQAMLAIGAERLGGFARQVRRCPPHLVAVLEQDQPGQTYGTEHDDDHRTPQGQQYARVEPRHGAPACVSR